MCACWVPSGGFRSVTGTGVRYSCELPLGEELNLGPLEE